MGKTTILLVDDDPDFLDQHRFMLESAGYTVVTARCGEEAWQAIQRQPVDGAIVDIMMETPDAGFTLARRIKSDKRLQETPVLLLSSINQVNAQRGIAYRYSDADRDDMWMPVEHLLEKPVKPQILIDMVREHMGAP